MSTEQKHDLGTILRRSAFPADLDVGQLRRRLAELASARQRRNVMGDQERRPVRQKRDF